MKQLLSKKKLWVVTYGILTLANEVITVVFGIMLAVTESVPGFASFLLVWQVINYVKAALYHPYRIFYLYRNSEKRTSWTVKALLGLLFFYGQNFLPAPAKTFAGAAGVILLLVCFFQDLSLMGTSGENE